MFSEYSMTDQGIFEEYAGFTEPEVKELCEQFDMNFPETRSWYDGYRLTRFQLVEAMRRHKFSNYRTSLKNMKMQ